MSGLRKLAIVLAVLVIAALLGQCVAHAAPPAHAGTAGPPPHARNKEKAAKADPDDNGRGPDRGDGAVDDDDGNNGCGNDEDRTDDCEGWCGRPHPVTPPPTIPPPVITPTETPEPTETPTPPHYNCTVYLYGRTPEVFSGAVDVRDYRNEPLVLAEANGFLEFHGNDGDVYKVMWYDPFLGHALSPVEEFTCHGVIWLYEPPSGAL